jgi:hypothetical protein
MIVKAAVRTMIAGKVRRMAIVQERALCQRTTSIVPKAQKNLHEPATGIVFKVIAPGRRSKRQILAIRRDPEPLK